VESVRKGGLRVNLVGQAQALEQELARLRYTFRENHSEPLGITDTPEFLAMEESPSAILREKPRASVRLACELVAQGKAGAVVSAGHSGALMIAGKHLLGTLPGVDRPAIATPLPSRRGVCLLLDSGANVDCKPGYLLQFARMGRIYARVVLGCESPRVALLSNGSEPGKGNELIRQVYPLMERQIEGFIGNLEPGDLFRGRADVIVCDGFVGNMVLKTAEATGSQLRRYFRDAGGRSPLSWIGTRLMGNMFFQMLRHTDRSEIGGSMLLGLKGVAVVAHGSSNARAMRNAIEMAQRCAASNLMEALDEAFAGEV